MYVNRCNIMFMCIDINVCLLSIKSSVNATLYEILKDTVDLRPSFPATMLQKSSSSILPTVQDDVRYTVSNITTIYHLFFPKNEYTVCKLAVSGSLKFILNNDRMLNTQWR